MKKKVTIGDLSAVVTGLLLAMNLPPMAPLWMAAMGGIFAILVVKMLFGGLGQNFMNPALGARCFLMISFTSLMTNFNCDTYTGATPLAALKAGENVDVMSMIIGRTSGTIGETSMVALIIGACIGGAMFGDNLSMISDTTIAATQTQGVEMKDKFRVNFLIALPAAICTIIALC